MAASMNFGPGGAEEDDDEFDDDGFFIGGMEQDSTRNSKFFDPVIKTSTNTNRGGFTGFGALKPKAEKPPSKNFKRASDKLSEMKERTLDMGDFQMAIVRGQTSLVKTFIDNGFQIDTVLKSGWTGLMYAASNANTELVQLLLDSGANPNCHKDMYTVLMAACGAAGYKEEDVLECVDLLLGKGAKPDACDRYHTTALMYAAREGRSSVICRLAECDININKQNNRGWTALTWAVSKQHTKAVKALLELNADPRKKHCDGQTVIDMAIQAEDEQMLAILEGKHLDVNVNTGPQKPVVTAENGVSPIIPSQQQQQQFSSREKSGTTYGELELFLVGLGLSNLVDVFHDQQVNFATFLQMTEDDLIQMGIDQIGVRKKIIDGIHSVHKKEWEKTSLPAVHYNKQLSCAECIAMVANIAKHTKYITTTVGFLQDQLKRNSGILDQLQDGTGPKQLYQHTVDTYQNISVLETQLNTLKLQLSKTLKKGNFDPPDLIKKKTTENRRTGRKLVAMVISGSILSVIIWRRQSVMDTFIQWISPIQ